MGVQAVASICAIAPADSHRRGRKEWEGGSVTIIVATAQGTLFQYAVHNLTGPQAPSCALEQEYLALSSHRKSMVLGAHSFRSKALLAA